jgi:aspartyl-tRNA(Asn)/glutamyl-tRNA(Gln) amidotransferase subunit C
MLRLCYNKSAYYFIISQSFYFYAMKLTRDDVKHIALLARLGLTDDDIDKFSVQLSVILDNFEILKKVDTTDIEPTAQSIALKNVFREDKSEQSYKAEDVLANAPQQDDNYFKVQAVLE